MSDNYITITTTKEVSEPVELKNKVLEFLQSKEYVEKELSDCVLSMKTKATSLVKIMLMHSVMMRIYYG